MLKSIFTQIWNRKQNNSWIVIELVLVFCLIWYISDYFFVLTYNSNIPNYRNIDHTFLIKLGNYKSDNSEYNENEEEAETKEANLNRIFQIIQNYPGIESLSISFYNSIPESGGYSGSVCGIPDDTTYIQQAQAIHLDKNSDFFRVFGYTTNNGKNPVSMRDFDWSQPNGIVISRSIERELYPNENSALGKEIKKDKKLYRIIGIVDNTKRFDYEYPQHSIYSAMPLSENIKAAEIAVRSNSTLPDAIFRENFEKEMMSKLNIGNFYLKNITSFKEISYEMKKGFGIVNQIQIRIYLMLFFLVNIILCVVGTFWYRVNTRKEEIGLRKALGSNSIQIRNNLLLEGLCLLSIATLFAMIIEYQFVHAGLIETLGSDYKINTIYLPDRIFLRFLITNGITWIIMAAIVIAAVWLPARKAAAMEAATALHYE